MRPPGATDWPSEASVSARRTFSVASLSAAQDFSKSAMRRNMAFLLRRTAAILRPLEAQRRADSPRGEYHRHEEAFWLLERRHVAGAVPKAFLNAREKAASDS